MQSDEERFACLGIYPNEEFQIRELTGYYLVDIENKVVRDTTSSKNGVVVYGLYEHILDGTWHVKPRY